MAPLSLISAKNAFRVMTRASWAIDWYHLVPDPFTVMSCGSLVSARMHQKGIIMRNGMKQTRHLKTGKRKIRSAFETGIFSGIFDAAVKDGLQSKVPDAPHSHVERCLSDQVVYADASVDTVVLQNFRFLLALLVVMLPASTMVLLIELYYHRNVQVGI